MTEEQPKFKPEIRLTFSGMVPVDKIEDAEELHKQLRAFCQAWTTKFLFNGQITKSLEPCCKKGLENAKNIRVSQR